MSALTLLKRLVSKSNDPSPLTEPVSQRRMASLVFGYDSDFKIQKTFLADVSDTSFLVPHEARQDTTGYTYLTNDLKTGATYSVGLLLADPASADPWPSFTWKRRHTVTFKGYINSQNHITIPEEVRETYEISDGDAVQVAFTSRVFDPERERRSYVPEWRSISRPEENT